MDKGLITVSFNLAAASSGTHILLPGAALDPDHTTLGGANTIVWFAQGDIESVSAECDTTADIVLEIFDLIDATGKPLALAAAPSYRYAVLGPSAVAHHSGHGDGVWASGVNFQDIRVPGAIAAIHANGQRWGHVFTDSTAGTATEPLEYHPKITCRNGMALRATLSAALSESSTINVTYRPQTMGAQRYLNSLRPFVTS